MALGVIKVKLAKATVTGYTGVNKYKPGELPSIIAMFRRALFNLDYIIIRHSRAQFSAGHAVVVAEIRPEDDPQGIRRGLPINISEVSRIRRLSLRSCPPFVQQRNPS